MILSVTHSAVCHGPCSDSFNLLSMPRSPLNFPHHLQKLKIYTCELIFVYYQNHSPIVLSMVKWHSFVVISDRAVLNSKWRHDGMYDCDLLAFLFSSTYQSILQRPCKYRSPSCFSVRTSPPWSRQDYWAMLWKDHSVPSRSDSPWLLSHGIYASGCLQ